ncbi:MAG: sigma-54 dependent transcriptional regulator [Gammaproteobacteria bacterium]
MTRGKILIVDDEKKMQRILEIMLRGKGHEVATASDGHEALRLIEDSPFDLIITDLRMPEMDGLTFLKTLREKGDQCPVIVVTAYGTIESAVAAMKLGATDYLIRPFEIDAAELAVERAFTLARLQRQNTFLRHEVEKGWGEFIGTSPSMQQVYATIRQVASAGSPVLITGETGTGKELVAQAIHKESSRSGLFVPLNCAAIPAEILESELFGYVRGAFTGANRDRIGKFELAHEGTIFLDEITEMSPALQAKLLRILQDGRIERLGSNTSTEFDVRIVAATNRDPKSAVREQKLREDLYYRLNVVSIALPPLRERREDIVPLAEHFLVSQSHRLARQPPVFGASAQAALVAYRWPGNVRELENAIERVLVLSPKEVIEAEDLIGLAAEQPQEETVQQPTPENNIDGFALQPKVEAFEMDLIERAVQAANGNKTAAARLLQISERTLWYKLKKYGKGN